MEEERLMLHASLLPSASHRASTTSSTYVPPVALDWLNTLEAKETRLRGKGDRLAAIVRAELHFATRAALAGITCELEGFNCARFYYPSRIGWALFTIGILILVPSILIFHLIYGNYICFRRPISDVLREGDTLLEQTLSIRDYVCRTPVSSVALSSPVDDIVRFDTRIDALIRRFSTDVRYLRLYHMLYIFILVLFFAIGFMPAVVGPWWMYAHAEMLFGD